MVDPELRAELTTVPLVRRAPSGRPLTVPTTASALYPRTYPPSAVKVPSSEFRSAGIVTLTLRQRGLSIFSMKNADLTITQLAASVPKAVRETEEFGVRGITRNGKAVAFLISRE